MKIRERMRQRDEGLQTQGPVNIVFLGDSVTHGCFEDGVFDYEAVYHARLGRLLRRDNPFMPVNIINAGIGGTTAKFALARLERDVLCHHPELVVICFGLNDVGGPLADYTAALNGIFSALTARGIDVIFMTPNMLNTRVDEGVTTPALLDFAHTTCAWQTSGRMDAFMDAARACAASHGVTLCDCYAIWKALAADGKDTTGMLVNRINHPTREMHELFAAQLHRLIME